MAIPEDQCPGANAAPLLEAQLPEDSKPVPLPQAQLPEGVTPVPLLDPCNDPSIGDDESHIFIERWP